jgi:hypothetical protein
MSQRGGAAMGRAAMGRAAASLFLLLVFAVVLGGCPADKPPKIESNIYPTAYKKEIIDTLKAGVFTKNETARVSNALVSDPLLQPIGKEQHYVSCVRYVAHGTVYHVAATATRIAYFYGGHINQLVPDDNGECAKAAFKPFPELDAVCIGTGCK